MTHAAEIILSSGESLTRDDIIGAVLALAQSEASFPCLSVQDTHNAVLLLVPDVIAAWMEVRENT